MGGFSFLCLEKMPRLLGSIGMVEGIGEGEFSISGLTTYIPLCLSLEQWHLGPASAGCTLSSITEEILT